MLRYCILGAAAVATGVLSILQWLKLWDSPVWPMALGFCSFVAAMAYGRVLDGLGPGKKQVGRRLLCVWGIISWTFYGALCLPIGDPVVWGAALALSREALCRWFACAALLGTALILPALFRGEGAPKHRGRAAFCLVLAACSLLGLLPRLLSLGLRIPDWIQDWSLPIGLFLSGFALLLGAPGQGFASGRQRRGGRREIGEKAP